MDGTYDHPSPVTFKHHIRKLFLGREVKLLARRTNCREGKFESFATVTPFTSTVGEEPYSSSDLAKELILNCIFLQRYGSNFRDPKWVR